MGSCSFGSLIIMTPAALMHAFARALYVYEGRSLKEGQNSSKEGN